VEAAENTPQYKEGGVLRWGLLCPHPKDPPIHQPLRRHTHAAVRQWVCAMPTTRPFFPPLRLLRTSSPIKPTDQMSEGKP
jgi:hypothetical protein